MLRNSINLAVASSNKNVSISASELEKLCNILLRLDTFLIPIAPAIEGDQLLEQQELYKLIRKDLGVPDELIDGLVMMAYARKDILSHAIFGDAVFHTDYPNVQYLNKIFDWHMFKAVADSFSISYTVELSISYTVEYQEAKHE